ncbi:unnamed protein product [Phaedon cochleariae]|uniref:Inter-alpha-trypsin inhibitor heavy chain H4-like n=1 Tax=Phaedon cochleariae TaxID=80249 RepID=A0A9N9X4U9_PHACE|nr:unnamed protein product [Phaedon cochleariae]
MQQQLIIALLGISLLSFTNALDTTSFVTSTSTVPSVDNQDESDKQREPVLPKIYEMRVDTNVSNRFAKSQVTSKVRNLDKHAQEATFSVVIPEQAYISGFTMEIDGKQYEAYIQEKEEAKNTYKNAVASGQSAGHVAVNARDSNRFTVSVNVEPQQKATFYLRYEELLARQNEKYEIVINIHPGQPVKQLDVQVNIEETRPLKFVKAPPLRSGNEVAKNEEKLNPNAEVTLLNKTSAIVKFSPNVEKQKEYASGLGTDQKNGLAGQFIVEYDVERDPQGGEVLVDGGYFVHFFAPSDLPPLPKQVVFVLDTSGSMEGIRVTQLKEAMRSILSELKPEDIFNIVEFGSIVKVWNVEKVAVQYESGTSYWGYPDEEEEPVFKNRTEQPLPPAYPATEENLKKAEKVVQKLKAFGGTDINEGLKTALTLIDKNHLEDKKHQPLIVFLTDGEATVGEVDNDKIIRTITELNGGRTPIFSLSFGDGADRSFLQKISLKNLGFARHIYEAADASLQLEQFYKEISSPLLSNVSFKYVSNVSEVTKTKFPILFHGSELVVAGHTDEFKNFCPDCPDPGFKVPIVEGWGVHGPIQLTPSIHSSVGPLERLWAYLTLKQILQQREAADNKTGPTQEALRIALKYSFVSDVSSLVVVKPNASHAVETEDASTDKRYPIIASGLPLSAGGPSISYAQLGQAQPSPSFAFAPAYSEPALYEESDYDNDRVYSGAGGFIASTTVGPRLVSSTQVPHNATAKIEESSEVDRLKKNLPWIANILNEDGELNLTSGKFILGLNETISDHPVCPKTPLDQPGECTLINSCPQIFDKLTSLQVYEQYFCDLKGFAGVCCPKEEKQTN